MHSSIKEVSFSWLAFLRRQPCYFWLVKVSAVYCCSISPPPPMGNGLSGGISYFNLGLLSGSRRDKARAGLACVVTVGWLVLLGGRGGCGAVSLSVVCSAGALLSSFPSNIGVPLEGLRIGCGVTGVSIFSEESAVPQGYPPWSVDSDPVLVVRESFNDLACCTPLTIVCALDRYYLPL